MGFQAHSGYSFSGKIPAEERAREKLGQTLSAAGSTKVSGDGFEQLESQLRLTLE